jgi:DNA repair protein RadA/Sms
MFVAARAQAAIGGCVTVTPEGRRALAAESQTRRTPAHHGGAPRRAVADLDSARVAMVLAVLMRHGRVRRLGDADVHAATVGGIGVREPAADLAIAIAAASSVSETPVPPALCAIGEVALSGDIRRVGGMDRRLAEAARLGFTMALAPADDPGAAGAAPGSAARGGMRIIPVRHIADALSALRSLADQADCPRRADTRAIRP